tara:strand:- start:196 stop:429 length:234 start_codon:yes stop_codon:yes gene_type:complete
MKFINVPIFIISLAVGFFFTYVTAPTPQAILVYPTPDNIQHIQYKDQSDGCFGFTSKEIACPKDKTQIREYPTQEKN